MLKCDTLSAKETEQVNSCAMGTKFGKKMAVTITPERRDREACF